MLRSRALWNRAKRKVYIRLAIIIIYVSIGCRNARTRYFYTFRSLLELPGSPVRSLARLRNVDAGFIDDKNNNNNRFSHVFLATLSSLVEHDAAIERAVETFGWLSRLKIRSTESAWRLRRTLYGRWRAQKPVKEDGPSGLPVEFVLDGPSEKTGQGHFRPQS